MFASSEHAITDDCAEARCFSTNKTNTFSRLALHVISTQVFTFLSFFSFFLSKVKLNQSTKPLWLHNKVKCMGAWSGEADWCMLQLNKAAEPSPKMQTTISLLAHKALQWLHEPRPYSNVFSDIWAGNYNFRKMPPEATVMSSEVAVWSSTCENNKHRENPAQPWHPMQGNWWGLCWTKQLAASPLNSLASGKTIKTRVPKENRTVQVQLYCVISEANIIILTVLLRKEEKKS